MRNDNNEKKKVGKFYGVGIGPGDPKLLTIKAKEVLEEADVIFVPKSKEEGSSVAKGIIEQVISDNKKFKELTFPMTTDVDVLDAYWQKAALEVNDELKKGKTVAFVTIGDPFVYSTYIYLLRILQDKFPEIETETIPGISAFNAASSRIQIPLVEAKERLAIIPVQNDLSGLKEAFLNFDTVVLMKVGAKLDKVIKLLGEMKLLESSYLITHVGHENEKIIKGLSKLDDKTLGYLSVIIVKCKKD